MIHFVCMGISYYTKSRLHGELLNIQYCKHDDKTVPVIPLQLLKIFIACQRVQRQQIKLLPWTLFSHSLGLIFFVMHCVWLHKTLHDRICMIHAHTVSAHLRMFFFHTTSHHSHNQTAKIKLRTFLAVKVVVIDKFLSLQTNFSQFLQLYSK